MPSHTAALHFLHCTVLALSRNLLPRRNLRSHWSFCSFWLLRGTMYMRSVFGIAFGEGLSEARGG